LTRDMPPELEQKLRRQGYHILGQRGGYKACQWQKKSLLYGDVCYKEKFYGIESHRCLQMAPNIDKCTHNCEFCWRVTPADVGVSWDQITVQENDVLAAEALLQATLDANIASLGGYNPASGAPVDESKYWEAREPKHVAISLAGEPALYPYLSEFIDLIHERDMTSFVVTNGTLPEVLRAMSLPTQLYVTLAAPDEPTYRALARPGIPQGWEKLMETQRLLSSLGTRTVNRLTMVAGRNMHDLRGYAKIIAMGEPDFIEVKGYMHLGSARGRLDRKNAPSHQDIRAFSEKLAALTGYYYIDEQVESRVVLLARSKHIKRLGQTRCESSNGH
jgi:tRNA wybutosine-synthesizing protein 1